MIRNGMDCTLDTFELARTGAMRSGEFPLARMPRLAPMLAHSAATVGWRVRGWQGAQAQGGHDDFMTLGVAAQLHLSCSRCLEPVAVVLDFERAYRLVASEAAAELVDLEDEQYDAIVGGRHFDLAGLLEDELIMALPPIPLHAHCELPITGRGSRDGAPAHEGVQRPDPFAALRRLRSDDAGSDA